MNPKKVLSIILIFFGIASFLGAAVLGISFYFAGDAIGNEADKAAQEWEEFQDTAIATRGTIVDTDNGTKIKYTTEEGDIYNVRLNVTSSLYPEGENVTVYYDKFNPGNAMVPEITESTMGILNKTFSGIGIIFGGIMGFFGIVMLITGIVVGRKSKE